MAKSFFLAFLRAQTKTRSINKTQQKRQVQYPGIFSLINEGFLYVANRIFSPAAGIRAGISSGKDRVSNTDKGFTPSYLLGEDMTHGFLVDVSSLVSFF